MMTPLLVGVLPAFALSLPMTLLCERLARRVGMVATLRDDRWHRQPVPLLGGLAIVPATLLPMFLLPGSDVRITVLAIGALAMACVGFFDDVRSLNPQLKLLAQILLALVLLYFDFVLRLTGNRFVDTFVTLFWIVGVTNAFNLLDNMDGLSATIACIAAGFRLLFFGWEGDVAGAQIAAMLVGGVGGFLVRNFPPAKIFMGDTGSLFIGFFLAGLSLLNSGSAYSRGLSAVLVIPVLLLLIPIFDTAFVTVTRLFSGRPVSVGGRDHTSHRLVAVGLSERQVLALFGLLSAASGGVAVLSYRLGLTYAVVLLAPLLIAMVLLGVYLNRVRAVRSVEEGPPGAVLRILVDFQYKRQIMMLLLDVCLIVVAYYASYLIRFEDTFQQVREHLYASLPIVLGVQIATLAAFRLYRGVWQYTGVSDLLRIVKASTAAVMVTIVFLIYITRFVGFSRTVFILDWLLLVVLVGGSRCSFRFFAELFRAKPASFGRVLIYGAGDGGELILREILNNAALERTPLGFIDDDRAKHHTRIHGYPVLGDIGQLERLVREHGVTEMIISSGKIAANGLTHVTEVCERLKIPLRHASIRLE